MRRLMLIAIFGIISWSAYSEESLFTDPPGSYVIYHDTRFNDDVYVGLAYLGNNAILARSFETRTGKEVQLVVELTVDSNNKIDLGKNLRVLKGDLNSSDAAKRVIPMILNWATTWHKNKTKIDANLEWQASTDDDYFYTYWVPIFQIRKIDKDDDHFTLSTAGILKKGGDPRFFDFKGFEKNVDSDSFEIASKEKKDIVLDGLKIPLDTNWKTEDNKVYRIKEKTDQDAAFFIETIDIKKQGIPSIQAMAKFILIGNQDVVLVAEGSKVFKNKGTFNCFIRMVDPMTFKVSIQQTQLIDRGDDVVSIASLASFETLYNRNKQYFDKIIY